jgi:sugar (pentulose or hexulose) kinase
VRRGWVGLDVGTTSSKAVVYDDHGQPLGAGRVPTVWTTAGPNVEIDPDVLRAGALAAVNEAVAATATDVEIAGIGLASMGETGVLVDRAGHPVAAAIAWHDPRDGAEVAALGDQIGRATFERRTGKPLRSQFSLTKHRWLLDHEPATRAAVRRFNVAEWVARGLGADECCELSLAGRTGWYDLFRRTWDEDLLAWSGAHAGLMPPLVEAGVAIGAVRSSQVHPRLRGAVITLAGHDHQSAAVGCGAEDAGDELDSSGTAEALVRTVEPRLSPDEVERLTAAGITVDVSIQPGRWSLLGGTQGGLIMARALGLLGIDPRRLGLDEGGFDAGSLGSLDAAAIAVEASPAVGLAVTIADGTLEFSITGDVTPAVVWRTVVDAVTREAAGLHETISAVAGPCTRIVAAGGWCASAMVLDAKRRLLGDITLADVDEPGAFGAAILAARAAGHLDPAGRLGPADGGPAVGGSMADGVTANRSIADGVTTKPIGGGAP